MAKPDDDARRAIEHRLADILDAAHAGDLQRLASSHLDSPKFTKFNDSPPAMQRHVLRSCTWPTPAGAVCVCSESPLGHALTPVFLQVRSPGWSHFRARKGAVIPL
jgi:hypothetical protein